MQSNENRFYRNAEHEPEIASTLRDDIQRAVGAVLYNLSNFPEPAQARLAGQDMEPLRTKLVDAVIGALGGKSA